MPDGTEPKVAIDELRELRDRVSTLEIILLRLILLDSRIAAAVKPEVITNDVDGKVETVYTRLMALFDELIQQFSK